ncbi:MAG: hypothetical protein Q9214_000669 [Letrouitia sp. 1 TL-2023]
MYDLSQLDIEATRGYLGAIPGTVSAAGYLKEFQRHYTPHRLSYRGSTRFSPNVSRHVAQEQVLYNRFTELKYNMFPIADALRDAELLQEVLGDKSLYGRTVGPYLLNEQTEDLKTFLSDRRHCMDFETIFSVLTASLANYDGRDFNYFLAQVILSQELLRRLEIRSERIESQILANSMLVAERVMDGLSLITPKDTEKPRIHLKCDQLDRQIDGLVRFAELLKWPYLNAARTVIEDSPYELSRGEGIGASMADWMYCALLPGKWASVHAMGALVECTPELDIEYFPFFQGGLSLKEVSYWRTSSALGKVLASRNLVCAMGWVGPCPAIDFPSTVGFLQVDGRKVGPPTLTRPIEVQTEDLNELRDPSQWFVPQPPQPLLLECRLVSIKIKVVSEMLQAPKRAMVEISLDGTVHEFTLYTNPHFITPPRCRYGPHKIHDSERKMYEEVVDLIKLKDSHPSQEDVIIVNAMCKGGETFARAWCSETGQCAVLASDKDCCYTCAVKCASSSGTGVKILIWSNSS